MGYDEHLCDDEADYDGDLIDAEVNEAGCVMREEMALQYFV